MTNPAESILQFVRSKSYELVRELGQGACGKTVLLRDPQLQLELVCKKYAPVQEVWRDELSGNFVREIRLLYQLHHVNVVRVFQHYIYEEKKAGFILMEFVPGNSIDEYLRKRPEQINELFLQAIDGFRYLEGCNVLHRDIRPANILVREDGQLKIIDLGFGKHVAASNDFDKSVSLNWWCELPIDFAANRYDFSTEVYFVGKLFEMMIAELSIESFKYKSALNRMCQRRPEQRAPSFAQIFEEVSGDRFVEIGFSAEERASYIAFADAMESSITRVSVTAKYVHDPEKVMRGLEEAFRSFMLEDVVPDSAVVTRCFLQGAYYYKKRNLKVALVADFIRLLKGISVEKRNLVLTNLKTRIDAIERYSAELDDIPF